MRIMSRISCVTDSTGPPANPVKTDKGTEKRTRLVAAARRTLHQHGVEHSTLAEIAEAADIPIGNVYYYFKTKDDLVRAVVANYDSDYVLLRSMLDRHDDPKERLKALVAVWISAKERVALYGCPIGSLCSELGKRDPDEISNAAGLVLGKLVTLAQEQFEAMGRDDARDLAITMVAAYEGAALLSNSLHDPNVLVEQAARLTEWLDELSAAEQIR
jgi:TetR/AcrR family transcriptional regulator, transcriptional repressor for nem operon